MFERFTEQARRVIVLAQQHARRLDHDHVGTEHLLLGLIRQSDGTAARALESLGVTLDRVEQVVARGSKPVFGHAPFTAEAQSAFDSSLHEAFQLGHHYVDTEHLLLGVLHVADRGANHLVTITAMEREQIRAHILRQLVVRPGRVDVARPSTNLFASVTFTTSEHAVLVAAAANAGQPVAAWMKNRLLAAARDETG